MAIIAADHPSLLKCETLIPQLQKDFPDVSFVYSAGIHPHEAKDFDETQKKDVRRLSQKASCIGETGLDFHYDLSERTLQEDVFRFHIQLAKETQKGLVIHCRNSAHEILEVLDQEKISEHPNPGVIHCFAESYDIALEFLKRGFFVSFSGILTFKNAESLRESAAKIPLDRLLIETDSPWLAPVPKRGKENEPSYVRHTFETLASLRSEPKSELAKQLWKNSCKLFGIDEHRI